jgi:hypothetical protein
MQTPDVLNRFIDDSFRYDFNRGPAEVRSIEDARIGGLNCISLAHLALRDLFGVDLPPELHCAELYRDTEHFESVPDIEEVQRGDLVWFGIAGATLQPDEFRPIYEDGILINWRSFPVKHVSVFTGVRDDQEDPLLLHTTHLTGTNVVWPLRRFSKYRRYQKMFGITRLVAHELHTAA